jgi:hypothetical protein
MKLTPLIAIPVRRNDAVEPFAGVADLACASGTAASAPTNVTAAHVAIHLPLANTDYSFPDASRRVTYTDEE